MRYYRWLNKNTDSLKGKTVVISGSTGGIGQELCEYLAFLGANIIWYLQFQVVCVKLLLSIFIDKIASFLI